MALQIPTTHWTWIRAPTLLIPFNDLIKSGSRSKIRLMSNSDPNPRLDHQYLSCDRSNCGQPSDWVPLLHPFHGGWCHHVCPIRPLRVCVWVYGQTHNILTADATNSSTLWPSRLRRLVWLKVTLYLSTNLSKGWFKNPLKYLWRGWQRWYHHPKADKHHCSLQKPEPIPKIKERKLASGENVGDFGQTSAPSVVTPVPSSPTAVAKSKSSFPAFKE